MTEVLTQEVYRLIKRISNDLGRSCKKPGDIHKSGNKQNRDSRLSSNTNLKTEFVNQAYNRT